LFGIYIDELEAFLHEHIQDNDGCLLHQVLISILPFVDDAVLLASSTTGLQRQLDALALFCDLRQLTVNLGKTKVMIFNAMLPEHGAKWERFRKRECQKRHFPKISEVGVSDIYIYIYIYITFILKKHAERQISCRIYETMHICTLI
jgi:hypothetical protein